MEPSRDNPFVRFNAFWCFVGILLLFAAIFGVLALLETNKPTDAEGEVAKARYATKHQVEAAQLSSLSPEAVTAAIPVVAKELLGSKPVAVETAAQVVPGSPTAKKIQSEQPPAPAPAPEAKPEGKPAATPAPAPAAPSNPSAAPAPAPETSMIDPAVMEIGQAQYALCTACHGQEGQGGDSGPPLAGSEWVTGPSSNLIKIQLRGLIGPIKVKGVEHNIAGGMYPMAYQTDEQIAAVLTFVRNSFGNKAGAVKPAEVNALRSEVGKPQITVEELIQL